MLLDQDSQKLLQVQAQSLLQSLASLQEWHNGKHGKLFRICDNGTLSKLREIISFYASTDSEYQKKLFDSAQKRAREIHSKQLPDGGGSRGNISACRSAAPLLLSAMKDPPESFTSFWKYGIADGGDVSQPDHKFPNPLFIGALHDTSTLHYGTDPVLGFHLASAYAPLAAGPPSKLPGTPKLTHVVVVCKAQFGEWCSSFRNHFLNAGCKSQIRLYLGDALAFCHALQAVRHSGGESKTFWYRDQSHFEPLALDSEDYGANVMAPTVFNIIDTSNLLDHLGALNLLIATAPLLDHTLEATLHTEALAAQHENLRELVDTILCGHFPTLSTVLGLMPTEYWTNCSSISNAEDTILNSGVDGKDLSGVSGQMPYRITWKQSSTSRGAPKAVRFDGHELARVLHQVYIKMFQHEDVVQMLAKNDIRSMYRSSIPHYHRGSLASFLAFIKKRVIVDWDQMMSLFTSLIENNSPFIMGMNYIQEFYLHLHLTGTWSTLPLKSVPSLAIVKAGNKRLPQWCSWKALPSTLCVTLQIPRQRLKAITDFSLIELGTPILQCVMKSTNQSVGKGWHNIFSMVQAGFGKIVAHGARSDDDYNLEVKTDDLGWSGKSCLIVSFLVPTTIALQELQNTVVELGFQVTPQSLSTLSKKLGMELNIFRTSMEDETSLFVTKHRPNQNGYPLICGFTEHAGNVESDVVSQTQAIMTANIDSKALRITTMTGRLNIVSEPIKIDLVSGAVVQTKQTSPWTIEVHIGKDGLRIPLVFPLPVLQSRNKIKIARKSSYIEVIAPFADPRDGLGFPHLMFPCFPNPSGPIIWNVPHLYLDKLPMLKIADKSKLDWLTPHTSLALSARERRLRNQTVDASARRGLGIQKDLRVNFKDSIFSMFLQYAGLQGHNSAFFTIYNEKQGGGHMNIFVKALRLDLANRTVVLDAAALPIRMSIMHKLDPFLQRLAAIGSIGVMTDDDELALWKEMLPAWAERCRTWKHRTSCEYVKTGKVPASMEFGENPLCSCGQGKVPYSFDIPGWNVAAKYATRIAISPVFSVPFVESTIPDLPNVSEMSMTPKNRCAVCGAESGQLLRCSRCMNVKYCSSKCQKEDWKIHKLVCKKTST